MFKRHVTKYLSAYCHRQLDARSAQRVENHLQACARCRRALQEIQLGINLAQQLPLLSAPSSIWQNIEAALNQTPARAQDRWAAWRHLIDGPRLVAAMLMLVAIAASVWFFVRPATPIEPAVNSVSWEVARLAGAPQIGTRAMDETAQLGIGEWLETDRSSRAKINVGEIGHVEVDPNSRLRLVEATESEHRLALQHGRLHAVIWAPPRLFFIDTPSAVAVDYGCAYTLEVDEQGRSLLQVTSGWVALELHHQESLVPAGAACETRPVTGPGTPYFFDAPPAFRAALQQFDFENGGSEALINVLRTARRQDTLSIWHLLFRAAPGAERLRVYRRLAELVPPPAGVTEEGALLLNREMLERWRDELQIHWFTP